MAFIVITNPDRYIEIGSIFVIINRGSNGCYNSEQIQDEMRSWLGWDLDWARWREAVQDAKR